LIGDKVQLLSPLFASKNVELKSINLPGLKLKGDGGQIESLVVNLLQNALQSVGSRGKVAISTGFIPRQKDRGPFVEIKVRDNGPGITKEKLTKIFEPFYSTRTDGTGLGLAICRKIVENHKGFLMATSPAKKGTSFKITLPGALKT
jgi:signal transduction histidine kinase